MTDCATGSDFRAWCNHGLRRQRAADHDGDHCTRYLATEHLTFPQVAPKFPGRTTA